MTNKWWGRLVVYVSWAVQMSRYGLRIGDMILDLVSHPPPKKPTCTIKVTGHFLATYLYTHLFELFFLHIIEFLELEST